MNWSFDNHVEGTKPNLVDGARNDHFPAQLAVSQTVNDCQILRHLVEYPPIISSFKDVDRRVNGGCLLHVHSAFTWLARHGGLAPIHRLHP